MSTDINRTVEHSVDEEASDTALAMPDEHMEISIELSKVKECTIRPGLMRLPVTKVTSAENSPKLVIELNHPIIGDIKKFKQKPTDTWREDNELVRILEWYGYTTRNYHQLQTERLYVEYDEDGGAKERDKWKIVKPPEKGSYLERIKNKRPEAMNNWEKAGYLVSNNRGVEAVRNATLPDTSWGSLMFMVLLSSVIGWLVAPMIPVLSTFGMAGSGVAAVTMAVIGFIMGAMIIPPPRDG